MSSREAGEIAAAGFQDSQEAGPAYPWLGSGFQDSQEAGPAYPWQGSGPAEILEHRALHPAAACSSARMDSSAAPRRVEAHPAEQVAHLQDRAALLLGAAHSRLGTVAAGLSTPDTAAGATLLLVQVEAWAGQRATARAPASSQAASDAAPEHRPLDSSAPDVSMRQQGGGA